MQDIKCLNVNKYGSWCLVAIFSVLGAEGKLGLACSRRLSHTMFELPPLSKPALWCL